MARRFRTRTRIRNRKRLLGKGRWFGVWLNLGKFHSNGLGSVVPWPKSFSIKLLWWTWNPIRETIATDLPWIVNLVTTYGDEPAPRSRARRAQIPPGPYRAAFALKSRTECAHALPLPDESAPLTEGQALCHAHVVAGRAPFGTVPPGDRCKRCTAALASAARTGTAAPAASEPPSAGALLVSTGIRLALIAAVVGLAATMAAVFGVAFW